MPVLSFCFCFFFSKLTTSYRDLLMRRGDAFHWVPLPNKPLPGKPLKNVTCLRESGSRFKKKTLKSQAFRTFLIYILGVVFNTAPFVCFDNGSYLLVRAVFRTIIALYKSLIVFLSTCSSHQSGIANLIEERSSRESLLRLSPFS